MDIYEGTKSDYNIRKKDRGIMENGKAKNRPLARYISIGLLLGLSFGAGMKNIPAGIGIGLALGAMFYQLSRNKSDKGKDDGEGKNNTPTD